MAARILPVRQGLLFYVGTDTFDGPLAARKLLQTRLWEAKGSSGRIVGKPEVIARHGAVIDVFQHGNKSDLRPGRYALRFPSLRRS